MILIYWTEQNLLQETNTEVFLIAIKVAGLEANVDKTKYMVMFRDLNAERSQNIKPDNSSFEK